MFYKEMKRGNVGRLDNMDKYRLFFLLEGKVYLSGKEYGIHILQEKEFILIPPNTDIQIGTFVPSRYALVCCNNFRNFHNKEYLQELHSSYKCHYSRKAILPIREKLGVLLNNFSVYSITDYQFSTIHDTIFVILRSLYTAEEMASLLSPILVNRKS